MNQEIQELLLSLLITFKHTRDRLDFHELSHEEVDHQITRIDEVLGEPK